MVQTVTENIFDTDCDIICCQVNCGGIVNSGLALKVKERYPEVYRQHWDYCQTSSRDNNLLGTCQIIPIDDKRSVALLYCQDGFYVYGRHNDWPSLRKCIEYIHDNFTDKRIAYPYLFGCKPYCSKSERARDWEIINNLINYVYKDDGDVTIYKDEVDPLEGYAEYKKMVKERMKRERIERAEQRAKELENL